MIDLTSIEIFDTFGGDAKALFLEVLDTVMWKSQVIA